jgi:hypothetical protein
MAILDDRQPDRGTEIDLDYVTDISRKISVQPGIAFGHVRGPPDRLGSARRLASEAAMSR